MSIRVTCPHCAKSFKVADRNAGDEVECIFCDADVAVPEDQANPSPARRMSKASSAKERPPRRKFGLRSGRSKALGAFGSICLVVFGIGLSIAKICWRSHRLAQNWTEVQEPIQAPQMPQVPHVPTPQAAQHIPHQANQFHPQINAAPSLPALSRIGNRSPQKVEINNIAKLWRVPVNGSSTVESRPPLTSIRLQSRQVRSARFASPESARIVLESVLAASDVGRIQESQSQLDFYDLTNGNHLNTIRLPGYATLLDLSPDGNQTLVRLNGNTTSAHYTGRQGRLDIYSAQDGRHRDGWEPYANEIGEGAFPASAAFVDNENLLTLSQTGKLTFWSLNPLEARYEVETGGKPPLVLTPGRKYGYYFTGTTFRCFNVKTLQTVATLDEPQAKVSVMTAAAINAAGDSLVAAGKTPMDVLVQWNLKTGRSQWEFSVLSRRDISSDPAYGPDDPYSLLWCADGYVMFQDYLFDPARRGAVWAGGVLGRRALPFAPDDRYWYVEGDKLCHTTLPDQTMQQELKTAKVLGPPAAGPGTPVTLEIAMNTSGPAETFLADEARNYYTRRLREVGYVVQPNQPLRFVVRTSFGQSGHFEPFLESKDGSSRLPPSSNAKRVTIPVYRMEYEAAFVNGAGQKLWTATQAADIGNEPAIENKSGETWIDAAKRIALAKGIQNATNFLLNPHFVLVPKYLHDKELAVAVDSQSRRIRAPIPQIVASGRNEGRGNMEDALSQIPVCANPESIPGHFSMSAAAYSPDGAYVATGDTGRGDWLKLFDVAKDKQVGAVKAKSEITAIAFTPDSQQLAYGTSDGVISFLDVKKRAATSRLLANIDEKVTSLSYSPDGEYLLCGTKLGKVLRWEIKGSKTPVEVIDLSGEISGVAFIGNENTAAMIGLRGQALVRQIDPPALIKELELPENNQLNCLATSSNRKLLAIGTSQKGAYLFNTETWEREGKIDEGASVLALSFTRSGHRLAIGGKWNRSAVWEVATSKPLFKLESCPNEVDSMTFSPDGSQLIAIGRHRGGALLWNTLRITDEPEEPVSPPKKQMPATTPSF